MPDNNNNNIIKVGTLVQWHKFPERAYCVTQIDKNNVARIKTTDNLFVAYTSIENLIPINEGINGGLNEG